MEAPAVSAVPPLAIERAEAPPLPAIPGPTARRMLTFEFLALAEYWVAPLLLGVTNYAGIWSDAGIALFVLFTTTLALLVFLPLSRRLVRLREDRRGRFLFHGVWAGAFAAGLFLTNTFQFDVSGPSSGGVLFGSTTVYTPFGAWPSLTFYVPAAHFFGTLNGEIVTILLMISVLGSAGIRLAYARDARACPPAAERAPWWKRLASLAVWSPYGLITGCSACAPLYLAMVGLVAPTVAAGGLSKVPLVPWIGFAGLLYLVSFGLALRLLQRSTTPRETDAAVSTE